MAAPSEERQALAAAKLVISETLVLSFYRESDRFDSSIFFDAQTEFQKQCRSLDYRRFVALVRCVGVTMIRSLGGHRISFIKSKVFLEPTLRRQITGEDSIFKKIGVSLLS